jgi:hypothetical protein
MSHKSKPVEGTSPAIYEDELKVMRLARFPSEGLGLKDLILFTRRKKDELLRDVECLVRCDYLEDVEVDGEERVLRLTELGRKEAGMLDDEEIIFVRLPAEEMVMRIDQLARLLHLSEDEVRQKVESLVERGYLEWEPILDGEKEAIWPTELGLEEAGFSEKSYRTRPTLHTWPHTFSIVSVREAILEEFREEGDEWESERMRSRRYPRMTQHMPDGVLNRGDGQSIAVEIELSGSHRSFRPRSVKALAETHSEVRIYCTEDDKELKDLLEAAVAKMGLTNVKILDIPGELVYHVPYGGTAEARA